MCFAAVKVVKRFICFRHAEMIQIKSNLFESGSEAHIQVKEIKHRETQTHSNTKAHSKKQATIQ